jgi:transcriptional regulator GlxA family with amidase domain
MHLIAVLVLDGLVPFDLGTATQVFLSARGDDLKRLYDVRVCGPAPVTTEVGFTIVPDHGLEQLEIADTVIVPGIHRGGPVTD